MFRSFSLNGAVKGYFGKEVGYSQLDIIPIFESKEVERVVVSAIEHEKANSFSNRKFED